MFTDRTTKRWRGSWKRQSARKNPGMYGYGIVAASLVMAAGLTGCGEAKEVALARTESSNPIVKTDDGGERIYGGDPSVLVDGDTVYLDTTRRRTNRWRIPFMRYRNICVIPPRIW